MVLAVEICFVPILMGILTVISVKKVYFLYIINEYRCNTDCDVSLDGNSVAKYGKWC